MRRPLQILLFIKCALAPITTTHDSQLTIHIIKSRSVLLCRQGEKMTTEIRQEFIDQAMFIARNAEVLPGGVEELVSKTSARK